MTEVVTTAPALAARLGGSRRGGRRVGLVPTMGALHAGHRSLVERSVSATDITVVSIFVNPLQFGPDEDFASYPRDLDHDLALLDAAGAHVAFVPGAAFAPPGLRTTVHVGELTVAFEGERRPGHFDGVTTVVARLFGLVRPDAAYFGEKDYQQLVVVRRMAQDLLLGVEVVGCPTVRDPDGLALSSRNAYLSADQRSQALALSATLRAVAEDWDGDADRARSLLRAGLAAAAGVRSDYAEVVDPDTLRPVAGGTGRPARALAAVAVGAVRLLDNVGLGR